MHHLLIIALTFLCYSQAIVKPPAPTIHNMETVLLEQYLLLKDHGRPIPELLYDVVRDISRRRSSGCRTTAHYEMETELLRNILQANSYLYVSNLQDPLSYLDRECGGGGEREQHQQQ
jgi:hypothetical protein